MSAKRKICTVTTTRAEYGLLSRLIEKLHKDPEVEFQLIVSGMHLSDKFGNTISEITQPITKTLDIEIEAKPSRSAALAVEKFSLAFEELKPDILIILGDRYEIMGVAMAAMLNNIPIAHIHGGDTTQGAIDEAIRHSVTKMSHLHFVTCEENKKRVIQLGENPSRVFNTGSLGVENIRKTPLMNKNELEKSLEFKLGKKNLLVTFHPVTLEGNSGAQFRELLGAFDELKDTSIIITSPNSDTGNEEIFELIKEYEKNHPNFKSYKSLGIKRYLSLMQFVDAVVGNSSSGIYEVPCFKIPTINIGNRQKGRIQANSIINCKPSKNDILRALEYAYEGDYTNTINPYEKENTADNILKILKTFDLNNILEKEFYDL
ncbi:UDP-N-acetylglucosamine 2-epimerase (hydrolyzing) [bacterium]|nr:UDP-N-acetylglucosamine 2-epimerase (hydrolyzing) [bacterium]